MATVLIIAAEELIPFVEDRATFHSEAEMEHYVQLAIEKARAMIQAHSGIALYNVVVTAGGSLMAMVRFNLDVHADPPIEVARFRSGLCPC
jgi:hypothetical protein